jgi:hypothetical protein
MYIFAASKSDRRPRLQVCVHGDTVLNDILPKLRNWIGCTNMLDSLRVVFKGRVIDPTLPLVKAHNMKQGDTIWIVQRSLYRTRHGKQSLLIKVILPNRQVIPLHVAPFLTIADLKHIVCLIQPSRYPVERQLWYTSTGRQLSDNLAMLGDCRVHEGDALVLTLQAPIVKGPQLQL